jgi:hypothetical protein
MIIQNLVYFFSGVLFSFGVFGMLFGTTLFNHYEVNGIYLGEENLVCYNPISLLDGGLKETVYHEECHALVFSDPDHFCNGEGWFFE